ncbi:hypothetical protein J6590_092347 [Homalodisca vitripennis]|nr:hypothetical protein J6590_092347 [Homalodisca vitripennis]
MNDSGLLSTEGGVAIYFKERFEMKPTYLDHVNNRLEKIGTIGKDQELRLYVCVVYQLWKIPYLFFTTLFHVLFIEILCEVEEFPQVREREIKRIINIISTADFVNVGKSINMARAVSLICIGGHHL